MHDRRVFAYKVKATSTTKFSAFYMCARLFAGRFIDYNLLGPSAMAQHKYDKEKSTVLKRFKDKN